jgi:RNA recognition motif-containing protein
VCRYSLIQVFSKFGKISKLDYLFHKTGPAKGKPRGYAFVEYATHEVRLLSFHSRRAGS